MNPDPKSAAPEISVIVSLVDHRDEALPCIEALTDQQDAPQRSFEIIVVSDGSEPQVDEVVKTRLRPHDQFLIEPSRNEYLLFNIGSQSAIGETILVIESHCIAACDFISRFQRAFRDPGVQAARCRSIGVAENPLEEHERDIFEDSFSVGLLDTSWNRVLIHGFALRRSLYRELGGFRIESGNFGPWVMGARLDRAGIEIEMVEDAMVEHHYMGEEAELREFIVRFCRGEWEYFAQGDQELVKDYFPSIPEWESQGQVCPVQVRRALCSVASVILFLRVAALEEREPFLWIVGQAAKRLLCPPVFRTLLYRRRSRASWVKARTQETRETFVEFWKTCIDLGRWLALLDHGEKEFIATKSGLKRAVAELDPRALYGWSCSDPNSSFRWVEPLFALSVELPKDAKTIVFDLALEHRGKDFCMQAGFPGFVRGSIHHSGERVEFDLSRVPASKVTLLFWFPPIRENGTSNYLGGAIEAVTVEGLETE